MEIKDVVFCVSAHDQQDFVRKLLEHESQLLDLVDQEIIDQLHALQDKGYLSLGVLSKIVYTPNDEGLAFSYRTPSCDFSGNKYYAELLKNSEVNNLLRAWMDGEFSHPDTLMKASVKRAITAVSKEIVTDMIGTYMTKEELMREQLITSPYNKEEVNEAIKWMRAKIAAL